MTCSPPSLLCLFKAISQMHQDPAKLAVDGLLRDTQFLPDFRKGLAIQSHHVNLTRPIGNLLQGLRQYAHRLGGDDDFIRQRRGIGNCFAQRHIVAGQGQNLVASCMIDLQIGRDAKKIGPVVVRGWGACAPLRRRHQAKKGFLCEVSRQILRSATPLEEALQVCAIAPKQ
ncbi:hypothetical protein ABID44_002757 [Aquamicrobium ahrensii]|uniref:Uncharacterized protein n=1 Tax=Aquamicrobium ahrensii TaxID=469551 RepID=A0ABV2KQP1_9HYPH